MQPNPPTDQLRSALADRYAIEREIASGGMATVYLAEDLRHSRKVAIKVLDPELAAAVGADRFLREIGVAANLLHPHILPLFDSGEAGGFLYFVMPYVDGESLRERLEREKQLPIEDAVRIALEIADALSHAHEEGVIHRDVKPANIMIKAGHALLADFGVAHSVAEARDERLTRTGTSLGTLAYMSPEQCTGDQDLDGRSDQYGLGCVLYEMLAGQPPFTGTTESIVRQHLVAEPRPITQMRTAVSDGVAAVLGRALAKTPADRFGTMSELARALREADQGPSVRPKALFTPRRAAVAALAVASVTAAVLAWSRPAEPLPVARAWMFPAEFSGGAEPELIRVARDLVLTELQRSPTIALVTAPEVTRALELAGRETTTTVDPTLALELAERGHVGAVLAGELDRVGATYSVRLRVLDVEAGGQPLAIATESAQGDDQLITAIGAAARSLRAQLGELQFDLRGNDELKDLITPSLPAYRKYREALSGPMVMRARMAMLHEALRLDTGFAIAMMSLTNPYANTGQYDSAMVYLDRALARPDRLTDSRKLIGRAMRASVQGDIPEAYRLQAQAAEEFGEGFNNVGIYLDRLGRMEAAAEYFRSFDRPYGMNWVERANQIWRLIAIGELEEAEGLMEDEDGPVLGWNLLVARGRWSDALDHATGLANNVALPPGLRTLHLHRRASSLAAMGAVSEARSVLESSVEMAPGWGEERIYEGSRMLLALASEAQIPRLSGTVGTDSSTTGRLFQAIAAASQGDSEAAEALLRSVEQQPSGTYAPYVTAFPMTEALVALGNADWDRIPDLVAEAAPGVWPHLPRGNLTNPRLLQWMVGDAYERTGQPDSAVVYFQMLTSPRVDIDRLGFAKGFAHRRLARLYGDIGDTEAATEHWQTFLDMFTRSDPELTWMVDEAKAELGR